MLRLIFCFFNISENHVNSSLNIERNKTLPVITPCLYEIPKLFC